MLIVFLNCESLWIKASAKLINVISNSAFGHPIMVKTLLMNINYATGRLSSKRLI